MHTRLPTHLLTYSPTYHYLPTYLLADLPTIKAEGRFQVNFLHVIRDRDLHPCLLSTSSFRLSFRATSLFDAFVYVHRY